MKTVGGKEGQWRQERKLSWGKDRRAEPGWVQLARARKREKRSGWEEREGRLLVGRSMASAGARRGEERGDVVSPPLRLEPESSTKPL